jgi:hypothetical protein
MKARIMMIGALCLGTLQPALAKGPVQEPKVLAAPTGLSADQSVCGKTTLRWSPVEGAGAYRLAFISGGISEHVITGTSYTIENLKLGIHAFKVKATDGGLLADSPYSNNYTFEQKVCTAQPCSMPTVTLSNVTPSVIWPPDHRSVAVTVNGHVESSCALSNASIKIDDEFGRTVTQALPVSQNGGAFTASFEVKASRKGHDLDGHQYHVSAHATNPAGSVVSNVLSVTVPHDMGDEANPPAH